MPSNNHPPDDPLTSRADGPTRARACSEMRCVHPDAVENAMECSSCRSGRYRPAAVGGHKLRGPTRQPARSPTPSETSFGGTKITCLSPTTSSLGAGSEVLAPWDSYQAHRGYLPLEGTPPTSRRTMSTQVYSSGVRRVRCRQSATGWRRGIFVQWDGNAVRGVTVYWARFTALRAGLPQRASQMRLELRALMDEHGFRESYDAWAETQEAPVPNQISPGQRCCSRWKPTRRQDWTVHFDVLGRSVRNPSSSAGMRSV
jgi:hypothetical protein